MWSIPLIAHILAPPLPYRQNKSNPGHTIRVDFQRCAISLSHTIIGMANKRITGRTYLLWGQRRQTRCQVVA
eukprot:14163975-Ditylum_brightwellii.AAC.1